MFKKTAIVAGLGLAFAAAAQADYRWEVGADYFTADDVEALGLDGTFYFSPVDDSKGPLAEAAFLDHASSLGLNYQGGQIDASPDDIDQKSYGIDGRWVTGGAGWILEGSASRSELDNPFDGGLVGDDDFEADIFTVGAGKYLTDSTTLVFSYRNTDFDEAGDLDSYRVDLQHLWQLGWGGVKVEAAYGFVDVDDRDDIDIYEIGGTYYPTKSLGISGAYRQTEDDGFELDEYAAGVEWFISQEFSLGAEYRDAELDDTDLDADAWVLSAALRF